MMIFGNCSSKLFGI